LHRRVISRFLTESYFRKFSEIIEEKCEILLEKWSLNEYPVNAHYDLSMLSLDIIMKISTGTEHAGSNQLVEAKDNVLAHALDYALGQIVLRTMNPLHEYLPNKHLEEILEFSKRIFDRVFDEAREKFNRGEGGDATMLSAMAQATNADGGPSMKEIELRDEITVLRGAGHETTSNTLCWCLVNLMRNPDKLRKLREEILDATDGGRRTVSYEQARGLKYSYQVIYETLRMFPTVPSFPREAAVYSKISNFAIPQGSFVFVS